MPVEPGLGPEGPCCSSSTSSILSLFPDCGSVSPSPRVVPEFNLVPLSDARLLDTQVSPEFKIPSKLGVTGPLVRGDGKLPSRGEPRGPCVEDKESFRGIVKAGWSMVAVVSLVRLAGERP